MSPLGSPEQESMYTVKVAPISLSESETFKVEGSFKGHYILTLEQCL